MKSYYSLVKIAPNSLSDDNLTIGIILSDNSGLRLKFSKTKKQISKSLVSVDNSLIDFLELEIEKKIKETNKLIKASKNELFDLNHIISSSYFDYLSKYSNGILKFSQPIFIEGEISDNEFLQLYKMFVDSEDVKVQNPNKTLDKIFYDKINTNLIEKVKEKVHINIKFDSKLIPAIHSFDMDCIGLNGAFVGAKSLPFNQSKEILLKTVNTYISVIAQLSISYNKNLSENKFFLISDEPSKKNSIESKYWSQLYKNENLVKLIPSDESAMVAEIIESRKAHKFLEV
jgi:hypothetical protein